MSASPRVVLGMPAYDRPDTMARTLESLLSQTRTDFAVVITDDRPSPDVQAIVARYRALDGRIHYEANPTRLGMIGNWRQAFTRGLARHPAADFFAWVSDHDIVHPRWLESLVAALDAHPRAVLAYAGTMRIYEQERRRKSDMGDTVGVDSRMSRLRTALTLTTAGNAIYGLFRVDALRRAGVFRAVLAPDRQVLCELASLGQFRQVEEPLWYREVARAFSYRRQRQMFFPGRPPLHTYLPANLQHSAVLAWDLGVRGVGRPEVGRLAGIGYAVAHAWYANKRDLLRDDARWRVALEQSAVYRRLTGGPPTLEERRRRRQWRRRALRPGEETGR